MSRTLNKLIRLAQEERRPVFIYDTVRDEATVMMDLESYERGAFGLYNLQDSDEENEEIDPFDDAFDENDALLYQNDDICEPNIESLENLEEYVHEKLTENIEKPSAFAPVQASPELDDEAFIEQTNRDLALYQAKREEKEREEIARVLEEELVQEPLSDPFEEDFMRPPEWHELGEKVPEAEILQNEEPQAAEIEPSYHPIVPVALPSPLNWSDWTVPVNAKPVPYAVQTEELGPQNDQKLSPQELEEDPIFLEEPLT